MYFQWWLSLLTNFSLISGTINETNKLLPYNASSIDFTFSHPINTETVSNNAIRLQPSIDSSVEVINSKTLRIILNEELERDQDYNVLISSGVQNTQWQSLQETYVFGVQTTAEAKVVAITPNGDLDNLTQSISVFYSVPMIPLTALGQKDQLPCPISITPTVEWSCKRISSRIVEFTPETHLAGATDYAISVDHVEWLLYTLEKSATGAIVTPDLRLSFSDYFSPSQWLTIRSNFPVSAEEIEQHMVIGWNNGEIVTSIESTNDSQTAFLVQTEQWFEYQQQYTVSFIEWIQSLDGNRPMDERERTISTRWFLSNVTIYQQQFDDKGNAIDSKYISYADNTNDYRRSLLPNKWVEFHLNFDEDVEINKQLIRFETSWWSPVRYTLRYAQEEKRMPNWSAKMVDNKQSLIMSINQSLDYATTYKLVLDQQLSPWLTSNITRAYTTINKLAITDIKFVRNTLVCLYTNEKIDTDSAEEFIQTQPTSRRLSVSNGDYACDPDTTKIYGNGKYVYALYTRLNPYTEYTFAIDTQLTDDFGNQLGQSISRTISSQAIDPRDKYVYNAHEYHSLIPDSVPLMTNIQTINVDSVDLDICEMTIDEYALLTREWYSDFNCNQRTTTSLDVTNRYRDLSNNVVDIENDILGRDVDSPLIAIRGSIPADSYENEFTTIYQRAWLTITLEEWSNKHLVFITSMDGQELQENVRLSFYSYDYNTDSLKRLTVPYTPQRDQWVIEIEPRDDIDIIVARSDDSYGMLDTEATSMGNYDFRHVGGNDTSQRDYLYLYTDRPIYKPGETIYFKWLLRTFTPTWYQPSSSSQGTLRVYDNDYSLINSQTVTIDRNANIDGSFTLPAEVSLGRFTFEFQANGSDTITPLAQFFVEEYQKPTFKVDVERKHTDISIGETVSFTITPSYYFGGKVVNTQWSVQLFSQSYYFDAKDYSHYQFGEGYGYYACVYRGECSYNDGYQLDEQPITIDESGMTQYNYQFAGESIQPETIYTHRFTIEDPDTKKTVTKSTSTVIHTTDAYVGITTPYRNTISEWIMTNGVVLDRDAQPTANKSIKLELYKQERKAVKQQGVNGIFYTHYERDEQLVNTQTVSSQANGEFIKKMLVNQQGEYIIKATYTWPNGESFVSSTYAYVAGDDEMIRRHDNNSITELITEKPLRMVGEEQHFTLQAPTDNGYAFITIEKDDAILDWYVIPVESFGQEFTVPVKDEYYPNFYTKVFVIGQQNNNPLPVYKRALAVTKVDTEHKKLSVTINTNKDRYQPGEQVTVDVQINDHQWVWVPFVNGSLSVVDQSVLALKWNPQKNLYAFFYDMKRYLWVITYSSLANLVEKLEIKDLSWGEKGGDGDTQKWEDSKKKRGNFKDTAFRQSNFSTNGEWYARLIVDALPDNLTTRVLEVVANTAQGNQVWVEQTTIQSTKPLLISDNLPAFFGSRDTITLSPVIFNKMGKDVVVNVTLTSTLTDQPSQSVTIELNADEQRTVPFSLTINDIGLLPDHQRLASQIEIKAEVVWGEEYDWIVKYIPIIAQATPEQVATVWRTNDISFDEVISTEGIEQNPWSVTINYGTTLFTSISDGINLLTNDDYGCLEQKFSSVMPYVYVKQLYNGFDEPYDLAEQSVAYRAWSQDGYQDRPLDEHISVILWSVSRYQKSNGWFVFRDNLVDTHYVYASFWLTSYIVESLAEMQRIGYTIDQQLMNNAREYLKTRFYAGIREWCRGWWYYCAYSDVELMKALHALMISDPTDYTVYKMYLTLDKNNLSRGEQIMRAKIAIELATNLTALSPQEQQLLRDEATAIMQQLLNNELIINPRSAYLGKSSEQSRFLNTTAFVEVASMLGGEFFTTNKDIIFSINRWLTSQQDDASTQDIIHLVKAILAFIEQSGEADNYEMTINVWLNGERLASKDITKENRFDVFTLSKSLEQLGQQSIVNIAKDNPWTIYYDITMNYILPSEKVPARDEWFFVDQAFYDYGTYKTLLSTKQQQRQEYRDGERSYDELDYPQRVEHYLTPITEWKVGQLVVISTIIKTPEWRDQVAFDGYIPAWSQLVNPNLDTSENVQLENAQYNGAGKQLGTARFLQREEYRTNKFFGSTSFLWAGSYELSYVIRLTHAGEYHIKPTQVFEFYEPEIFGRTAGKIFRINE